MQIRTATAPMIATTHRYIRHSKEMRQSLYRIGLFIQDVISLQGGIIPSHYPPQLSMMVYSKT